MEATCPISHLAVPVVVRPTDTATSPRGTDWRWYSLTDQGAFLCYSPTTNTVCYTALLTTVLYCPTDTATAPGGTDMVLTD